MLVAGSLETRLLVGVSYHNDPKAKNVFFCILVSFYIIIIIVFARTLWLFKTFSVGCELGQKCLKQLQSRSNIMTQINRSGHL